MGMGWGGGGKGEEGGVKKGKGGEICIYTDPVTRYLVSWVVMALMGS